MTLLPGRSFVLSLALLLASCSHCDRMQEQLAHDAQGRSVVGVLTACTSTVPFMMGSDMEESIELVLPSGQRETIFKFAPNPGIASYKGVKVPGPSGPEATWLAPDNLQITVGSVAGVILQRDHAQGVHVTYKIGMILSEQ